MATLATRHERMELAHEYLNAKAAISAGIFGGIIFLFVQMLLAWGVMDAGFWDPAKMIAAIVGGQGMLPANTESGFAAGPVFLGLVVHFALAIVYAFVGALMLHRLPISGALFVGTLAGLVLYIFNFYGFASAFEWFQQARTVGTIVNHGLFGLAVAAFYKAMQLHEAKPIHPARNPEA